MAEYLDVFATISEQGELWGAVHALFILSGALTLALSASVVESVANGRQIRLGVWGLILALLGMVLASGYATYTFVYRDTKPNNEVSAELPAATPATTVAENPRPPATHRDVFVNPSPMAPRTTVAVDPPPLATPRAIPTCPIGTALGWIDLREARNEDANEIQLWLADAPIAIPERGTPTSGMRITLPSGASAAYHPYPQLCLLPADCRWADARVRGSLEVINAYRVAGYADGSARWQVCVRQISGG
jgi:hypothetical protein